MFGSIVLLLLVDADYKSVYIDTGCQGCLSDGAILRYTSFYKAIITNLVNRLDPRTPPNLSNANDSFRIDFQRQASVRYAFGIRSVCVWYPFGMCLLQVIPLFFP